MDFDDFWHKYSWHNWPSNGSSSSHLTHVCFYTTWGKQNKRNMHWNWTTNVNKLEIRSHKNLMTAVWANEVHRLLTAVLPAIKRVAGDMFVFQQGSAPAHRLAKRYNCWSAKPQTSSLRICGSQQPWPQSGRLQALGRHATAVYQTTFKNVDELKEATDWNLDWSGARTLLTLLSTNGENACVLVFEQRADISNIYCRQLNNWTIAQTVSQTDWNVNQVWSTRVILIKW